MQGLWAALPGRGRFYKWPALHGWAWPKSHKTLVACDGIPITTGASARRRFVEGHAHTQTRGLFVLHGHPSI